MKEARSIYHHPSVGTHAVRGGIRAVWGANGWERGRLGYPVDEEHLEGDTIVQNFQKGKIVWKNSVGEVIVNTV